MGVSMKLDYRASSFVIVGGWNPNIVNETWIKKNLLDLTNEQVVMGIKGGGVPTGTGIRVSIPAAIFRNVGLAVAGERLELNLIGSNDFRHIEDCVQRLCSCQSNTLVSGYGVNFAYIEGMISNELINFFRVDALSQTPFTQSHSYAINLDGITTNITIDLNNAENKSAIGFNFHFNVDDLSALIQRMAEYPIVTLNEMAVKFVLDEYGLKLESEHAN